VISNFSWLILSTLVKIKFLLAFVVVLLFSEQINAQTPPPNIVGTIFVTHDAIIFSDSTNISAKIIVLNVECPKKKLEFQNTKPNSQKREIAKSFIKKDKTVAIPVGKPKVIFSHSQSNQDLKIGGVFGNNNSIQNPNPTCKSELVFHYQALNIPVFIHLEKIYTEEFSLSSESSKALFCRPPPYKS
jgi:hypothetical protein